MQVTPLRPAARELREAGHRSSTLQRAAAAGASARNHLSGRIVAIDSEGPLERVTVDCGFPLVSLITRDAREELALVEAFGDQYVEYKRTTRRLIPLIY